MTRLRAWMHAMALVPLLLALVACNKTPDAGYQGWIEADFVFVSPDEPGRIEIMSVHEGDAVTVGQPLFTLDDDLQRADVMQATATVTNARQTFERAQALLKSGAGTVKARDDAEQVLREAEARLNSAETRLKRRKVFSPVAGKVHQVYFRPGEMVPAGRPAIALLPPGNVKVRFFVPEAVVPTLKIGDGVRAECDGCAAGLRARISFISQTAEFTPPVIYSLEERAKLVFMVEARPEDPDSLRVGQPVSVKPVYASAEAQR
jgi:HlyD family secretion protein